MTKSVKTIVTIIGALSILSGAYLALTGSEFTEYFSGNFLGIVLIGTAFFYNDSSEANKSE